MLKTCGLSVAVAVDNPLLTQKTPPRCVGGVAATSGNSVLYCSHAQATVHPIISLSHVSSALLLPTSDNALCRAFRRKKAPPGNVPEGRLTGSDNPALCEFCSAVFFGTGLCQTLTTYWTFRGFLVAPDSCFEFVSVLINVIQRINRMPGLCFLSIEKANVFLSPIEM